MEGNYLKINDLVSLDFLAPELIQVKDDFDNHKGIFSIKDDMSQEIKNAGSGLKVRIAATHAGIITSNNMFYLPDKVKKGTSTFLKDFGKPILVHHDEKQDAIGRIIDSLYVDTSGIIKDMRGGFAALDATQNGFLFNDKMISDFCGGQMPFSMQIDVVRNMFTNIEDKFSLIQNDSYQGLGYAEIVADITNPDAIQKFLDGRYLTGSVGARTDRAVCSVCKQDWTKDDACVLPGAKVLMADGSVKNIEDIKVGDEILTHTGSLGKVKKIFEREYHGDVYEFNKVGNNQPIFITEEHPIYFADIKTETHRINKTNKRYREKVIVESGFVEAKDCIDFDKYVSCPIPNRGVIGNIQGNEAALLGLYAAEGSITNGNTIEFAIHRNEVEQFRHYFSNVGKDFYVCNRKDNESVSCRFNDKDWSEKCIKHVGKLATDKKLSEEIVYANEYATKSFLGAFIDGDGGYEANDKVVISTASENMANQILIMLSRIGIAANIHKYKNTGGPSNREKECWINEIQIQKSLVSQLKNFSIKLKNSKDAAFYVQQKPIIDDKIFSRCDVGVSHYCGKVYNFEVQSLDNVNSYVINGISVHNCEHVPGKIYDKIKMVLIAGNFVYDEYSMVNKPADRHSKALELYYNGKVKGIEIQNSANDSIYEVRLGFPQYENISEEEKLMKDKSKEVADKTATSEDTVAIQDSDKTEPAQPAEQQVQDNKQETEDEFITRCFDSEHLTEEEVDKLYDLAWNEGTIQDAKLSTEQRKKLKKSTFCGPDRSFPVPDCAHVTAARRLVGRAKVGDGTKQKILACVDRKAKALGCNSKTKDSLDHARILHMLLSTIEEHMYSKSYRESKDKEPILSEKDIGAITSIMQNLVEMVGQDSFVQALNADNENLKNVVKTFQDVDLLDEIIHLEETLGEVREELDEVKDNHLALKEEYEALQEDTDNINDELITSKEKVRNLKLENIKLLKTLRDGVIPNQDEETVAKLTDEILDTELETLNKDIDINKIIDKLGDGTSRNPVGEVENPTMSLEDKSNKDEAQKLMDQINFVASDMARFDANKATLWREATIEKYKKEGKLPIKE